MNKSEEIENLVKLPEMTEEIKTSGEIADPRNINKSENNKLESEESKQIILKSEEDESNKAVIKSKSDDVCHAENQMIQSQTEKSLSDEQKISLNKFVKNPLRRSARSRRNVKRNKSRNKEEAGEITDPLNCLEIRSAAQWKVGLDVTDI